jgi:hypothetical protein
LLVLLRHARLGDAQQNLLSPPVLKQRLALDVNLLALVENRPLNAMDANQVQRILYLLRELVAGLPTLNQLHSRLSVV